MNEHYNVIILGTGLKESLLAGMLATVGRKTILHIDRNPHYGGDTASLNLEQMCDRHGVALPAEYSGEANARLVRKFLIDVIPKFVLIDGKLVRFIRNSRAKEYLNWSKLDGSYVLRNGVPHKIPTTGPEILSSKLMSMFEKRRMSKLLQFVDQYDPAKPATGAIKDRRVEAIKARELFALFGIEPSTQQFMGHAMALEFSDDYLDRSAVELVEKLRVYCNSMIRGGTSPYVYPMYGLGDLPQSFCRMCAVFGGTYMLRTPPDEILFHENGKVKGIRVGDEVATCDILIADPSYFKNVPAGPRGAFVKEDGALVLGTYIMDHGIANAPGAVQVIVPQTEVGRKNDIYVTTQTSRQRTCPEGVHLGFVSTMVETASPANELAVGERLLGAHKMKFVETKPVYKINKAYRADGVFISDSYDASSVFNSTMDDTLDLYQAIMGTKYDLDTDYTEIQFVATEEMLKHWDGDSEGQN